MDITNSTSNCSSLLLNNNNTFPSNPDITGIGVRISLYVSTLLGFFMAFFFPHDLDSYRDAARTSLVTSTSVIIAALYARYNDLGLSLIDGQIVTMFVTAMTACYYSISKFEFGFTTRVAVRLHLIISAAFGILVYYDVDHFGGNAYIPECTRNDQFTFVIFSRGISATNPGLRIFALLLYSFVLAEFIWDGRERFTRGLLRIVVFLNKHKLRDAILLIAQHIAAGQLGGKTRGLPKKASAGGIVVIIYLIVTVEQMIQWNGLDAQTVVDQWTFGQTVAVVMLGDQIIKVILKLVRCWREQR